MLIQVHIFPLIYHLFHFMHVIFLYAFGHLSTWKKDESRTTKLLKDNIHRWKETEMADFLLKLPLMQQYECALEDVWFVRTVAACIDVWTRGLM